MNNVSNFKSFALTAFLFLAFASAGFSRGEKQVEWAQPEVIGVLYYADWCGSCKTLDPKIKEATEKLVNKPALLTTFDMTNLATQYQAEQLANALGLADLYQEIGLKTGFMVLIDPETGKQIDKISRGDTVDEIVSKIEAAIAG